jgi:hypothetical protein
MARPRKTRKTEDIELARLFKKGVSTRAISTLFQISPETVLRRLREGGVIGAPQPAIRHGDTRKRADGSKCSREYRVWAAMKQRCFNPEHPAYEYFGARGITVCERWLSYSNFLADMGRCQPGLTLERKDNFDDYKPRNCEWASWDPQLKNRAPTGTALANSATAKRA